MGDNNSTTPLAQEPQTVTFTTQGGNFRPPPNHHGYFVCWRTDDFDDLLRRFPKAFCLLAYIARRARYREGVSIDGVAFGECLLGKDSVGRDLRLSPREYRTAKKQLETTKLATFKTTNRGTIARLIDSRVFAPLVEWIDKPNDTQNDGTTTNPRQTSDKPPTPKNQGNQGKQAKQEKGEKPPRSATHGKGPALRGAELIHAENRFKAFDARIKEIYRTCARDAMGSTLFTAEEKSELADLKPQRDLIARQLGYPTKRNDNPAKEDAKPSDRNFGIVVGPTDYGTAKPRLQREREEAEARAAGAERGAKAEPDAAGGAPVTTEHFEKLKRTLEAVDTDPRH